MKGGFNFISEKRQNPRSGNKEKLAAIARRLAKKYRRKRRKA